MRKVFFTALLSIIALLSGIAAKAHSHHIRPVALGLRGSPNGFGLNLRYVGRDFWFLEVQHNWSAGTQGGSGRSKMNGLLAHYSIRLDGPNVRMYAGAGAHYGSWERYKDYSKPADMWGFDVVLGSEAIFSSRIGVSVDFKPAWNFIKGNGVAFMPNNTVAISGRYYIGGGRRR